MSRKPRLVEDDAPIDVITDIARSIEGRMPEDNVEHWPVIGDTPLEYGHAGLVEEIATELINRIDRFRPLYDAQVDCLYRNKKSWKKGGKTVFGECKLASGLLGFYSNAHFVILINLSVWKRMNPWQRVALVYHELRHAGLDESGNPQINPHDAEVFFDEIALFGTKTYADWQVLAAQAEAGAQVETQFHLFQQDLEGAATPEPEPEDAGEPEEELEENPAAEPVGV